MKCLSVLCALVVIASLLLLVDAKKKNKFEGDFEFVDEDEKNSSNQQQQKPILEKKKWIHDPSNHQQLLSLGFSCGSCRHQPLADSDLCKPLNCKKKELCLLEDAYTAVCVSKKDLHKNRDEILTKNKFLEEEAKRKAQADEMQDDMPDQEEPAESDSSQDDDVFYDSDAPELEEDNCKTCPVVKPVFLCGADNRTYSSLCRLDYHNCIHGTAIKVSCKGFCPCKDAYELKKQQRQAERLNAFNSKYQRTTILEGSNSNNNNNIQNNNINNNNINNNNINDDNNNLSNSISGNIMSNSNSINNNNNNNINNNKDGGATIQHNEDKHKIRGYNEVLDKPVNKMMKNGNTMRFPTKSIECKPQQLTAIGNRLLDWFSVIMADSKKRRQHSQKSKGRFSPTCKTESKWMFGHLDLNNDGLLSTQELYDLEHDQNERCIKPFIDTCDLDQDNTISPREWCRCFEKTDRPCAAVRRRISGDLIGTYAPECDSQGFYKPTQCHNAVGVCWCVDKHGVEFANTRTRGKPNCDDVINNASAQLPDTDDDDTDDDDDDSTEGSADRLLVF